MTRETPSLHSRLTTAFYIIGLLWFAVVDAPYLVDVILYLSIGVLATAQTRRGPRSSSLIAIGMAIVFFTLAIGYVPLAWREAGQAERIRQLRARVEREERTATTRSVRST